MKDLQILSVDNSNIFQLSSITNFSALSGKESLAQRIVKLLLTKKGSDFFLPNAGSNLLGIFGVYSDNAIDTIKAIIPDIIAGIVKSEREQQTIDSLNGIVYSDEDMLEDITVEDISYDKTGAGWNIVLSIKNKANESVSIQIP